MQLDRRMFTTKKGCGFLTVGLLAMLLLVVASSCDSGGSGGDDLSVRAPSDLTTDAGDAEVALDWDGVEDADFYNVYRATSSVDGGRNSPIEPEITTTSYVDESVENGTIYYYHVTAVVSDGGETTESESSNEARSTPFTNPTNLEATTGDSEIKLDWSSAKGAETYGIYRSTSSFENVSSMEPIESDISAPSYVDDSAENGNEYYYRVTSINPEAQESSASNEVVKTPFAEPPNRP